jgi:hypothetical protein
MKRFGDLTWLRFQEDGCPVCMYVCIYVCKGMDQDLSGHCTEAFVTYVLPLPVFPSANELSLREHHGSRLVPWSNNPCDEILQKLLPRSQSQGMCVAGSSLCRHLSQMGLFVGLILKRCPFWWHCPVSSPTADRGWFLFSFNSSLVGRRTVVYPESQ